MFCSNCGSNIPDGSNFCSVCGAKQEKSAPEPQIDDFINDEIEVTESNVESKTQPISFDWSNVKEESHKKKVPEVHSPWGTTGLSSNEIFESEEFAEDGQQEDHSRTMSFIDLLKQERDAKAQAAEEEARPLTEREEEPFDYSAFEDEEVKSYYVPPLYKIEEEPEQPAKHSAPEPVEETFEPTIVSPRVTEDTFHSEDISFDTMDFDTAAMAEKSDSRNTIKDLDLELAEILAAGTGKHAAPEDVDLFKEEELISEEPVLEEPVIEEPVLEEPVIEEPVLEEPVIEEPVIEEPVSFNEPVADEPTLEDINFDEPVVDEPILDNKETSDKTLADLYLSFDADETIAPEPVPESVLEFSDNDEPTVELDLDDHTPSLADTMQFSADEEITDEESEIEDLKRRLANLMGTEPAKQEPEIQEPEIQEPEIQEPLISEIPTKEELEMTEEEPLVIEISEPDIPDELEEEDDSEEETILEIQLGSDEDEEEESEPEKLEIKPETDAISVDDLEKDLFGEATAADVEAEATKKIDKFYTLYKKNEEFQKLLDEEYNKLKTEDAVPHVDDLLNERHEETPQPTVAEPVVSEPAPVEEPSKAAEKAEAKAAAQAEKEARKAAKAEAKAAAKAEGGSKLTVVAVIVAALLLIILGIILVLYCAPYSGLAMAIDSFLETITSLFSATDIVTAPLLM